MSHRPNKIVLSSVYSGTVPVSVVSVPRADCAGVDGAPCHKPARRRPVTKTFVVAGCDVDRRARAVECTYRADERCPRTPRYAATLGSVDTRYDDGDSARARSASLTTCSSASQMSCIHLQLFQITAASDQMF